MERSPSYLGAINPALSEISISVISSDKGTITDKKEELTKVSVRLNINYLKTPIGILTIIEMLLGLLACCIVNAPGCSVISNVCVTPLSSGNAELSGIGYIIFTGVICILGNLIFLLLHLRNSEFDEKLNLAEFGYSALAFVLYFIATCVQTWYSTLIQTTAYPEVNPYRTQWIATAIFCWVLLASYLFKTFWLFPFKKYC